MSEYAEPLRSAERLCADAFGGPARLHDPQTIVDGKGYRHAVIRCRVEGANASLPDSVILKKSNLGDGHVFREWAALALLNDMPMPIAPRLIGGDAAVELLVLEDLGDVRDRRLRALLMGDDERAADEALVAEMESLARMNAWSAGRLDLYRAIVEALPAARPIDFHQAGRLTAAPAAIESIASSVDVSMSDHAKRDLHEVHAILAEPGPFLALVQSDCCPSNTAMIDGTVRVYDFEVSAYRHALLDGAYARLRHLNCMDAYRIPPELQRRMEAAYRAVLAESCPAAADDEWFGRAMTASCAAWMAVLLEHVPRVMEADRPRGPASFRQRIVTALEAFGDVSEDHRAFAALAETARALHDRLVSAWSPEPIGLFPALAPEA